MKKHAMVTSAAIAIVSMGVILMGITECPPPGTLDADGDGWAVCGSDPQGEICDCNDNDASIHPDATELCDFVDNDCNAETPDGSGDLAPPNAEQDGVCAGSVQSCIGGEWVKDLEKIPGYEATEVSCDGLDNSCDGCVDGNSWVLTLPEETLARPACDSLTSRYYVDTDGDTYGDSSTYQDLCSTPSWDYVTTGGDCNEENAAIHPGATDICDNGIDEDCSGSDCTNQPTPPPLPSGSELECMKTGGQWVCLYYTSSKEVDLLEDECFCFYPGDDDFDPTPAPTPDPGPTCRLCPMYSGTDCPSECGCSPICFDYNPDGSCVDVPLCQ